MIRRFAWSFTFLLVAACGGSVSDVPVDDTGVADTAPDTTAKPDTSVDTATEPDTATDPDVVLPESGPLDDSGLSTGHEGGIACGTLTCINGDLCCPSGGVDSGVSFTCAPTCSGATIACTSPDNCGGNPCCTQITQSTATTPSALCTSAPSACEPKLDLVARGAQTRLCRNDADCVSGITSKNLPNCCQITYQGNTFKGCFNKTYAAYAGQVGATVVCP